MIYQIYQSPWPKQILLSQSIISQIGFSHVLVKAMPMVAIVALSAISLLSSLPDSNRCLLIGHKELWGIGMTEYILQLFQ